MAREKRADEVLDWLGTAIARGDYPVGQTIPTEPELMELCDVGRSTVREAIRVLGSLGVVETALRRGTVVTVLLPAFRLRQPNVDIVKT